MTLSPRSVRRVPLALLSSPEEGQRLALYQARTSSDRAEVDFAGTHQCDERCPPGRTDLEGRAARVLGVSDTDHSTAGSQVRDLDATVARAAAVRRLVPGIFGGQLQGWDVSVDGSTTLVLVVA